MQPEEKGKTSCSIDELAVGVTMGMDKREVMYGILVRTAWCCGQCLRKVRRPGEPGMELGILQRNGCISRSES